MSAAAAPLLTKRWYPLRAVKAYGKLVNSRARFDVIEAGRRSGKTELIKRMAVEEAWSGSRAFGGKWFTKLCAPTLRQARDIFWDDLLQLTKPLWSRQPHVTDMVIFLRGGAEIWVCGLDKPQRIEGSPVNRLGVDELADVKDGAWDRHLRPALDTELPGYPPARAWLFGVPRPGGQFAELARRAQDPTEPDFAYHTWTSEAVLSADKIASAKRTMDPRIYAQEYLAQRISMEGRAYYQFGPENLRENEYDPRLPLCISFDFNRSPGIAVVSQEQSLAGMTVAQCMRCGASSPGLSGAACSACSSLLPLETCTVVLSEVHIESGSNTPMVCTRLCNDWRHHTGPVICYGDATGGAKKTSSVDGSDWDLIRQYFAQDFPQAVYDVDRSNPPERARVNAVNMRCCNAAGERRLFVDPRKRPDDMRPAPKGACNLKRDLESQTVVKGGSGELDKDTDKTLGHAADALGYLIHKLYPATFGEATSIEAA